MELLRYLQENLPPFLAFVVGACIGSFLNVCVYRIPLERSIIRPGSHCAACGTPIPWYHNIPIISWFALRGRAACCGTRIDARYWMVELGTGLLFGALWAQFRPMEAVIFAVFVSGLTAACLIDLDHYIIPDRFSLGGCLAGFLACAIDPPLMGQTSALQGFSWSLACAILGALCLIGIAWLGTLIFHKEAMGMGDVKFMAAICAFLGFSSVAWVLPLSSFIGAFLGVGLILWRKGAWGTRIPYGPFLGIAAICWLFGGAAYTHYHIAQVRHVFQMSTAPMVDLRTLAPP